MVSAYKLELTPDQAHFRRRSTFVIPSGEKEKLIRVTRDASGRRCYTEDDHNWILFLKRLKETGMTIKDIKDYAELRYQGDMTMPSRLSLLKKHRLFVLGEKEKWEANLKHLDEKIQIYEEKVDR